MKQHQNRRKFIKSATGLIGLGSVPGLIASEETKRTSKVAVIRNERVISSNNLCNPREARNMVDKGLETITGERNPKKAWAALGVTENDVVGIKVNCNSWTYLLITHPDLVYALCDSLSEVVPPNNIIIYERYTNELSRGGYKTNKGRTGIRCMGTNEGGGFNNDDNLTKIVTDMCTKIINIPTLKCVEDDFAGSLFLKNHIGSIPPNMMAICHGNAVYCSKVCASPNIKDKTVLAVCDGLRGTYRPGVPWYWSGIVMSRDQVAAEYVSLQVINEKRVAEKVKPVGIPEYVTLAGTSFGLGTSDPGKIDVVKTIM